MLNELFSGKMWKINIILLNTLLSMVVISVIYNFIIGRDSVKYFV